MKMPKKNLRHALPILTPVLIAALVVGGFLYHRSEQERDAEREAPIRSPVRIAVEDGVTTLTVDEAMQERSGIQAAELSPASVTAGPDLYGAVLDLQPLVDLANRRAAAAAELEAATAAAEAAHAEAARVQALYGDDATASLKALQAARAAQAAAAARVKAAQANLGAIDSTALQQYGAEISRWATSPASPALASLLARREVLLRVVLPPGQAEPAPRLLQGRGDGTAPFDARLVSASPQAPPGLQGQAYFYRATAPLAAGLRVIARAPAPARAKPGLRIPASAIVWYGGQPWAYVRVDETRFERRPVDPRLPQDGDFVVTDGYMPGERVVVAGAQLLLSEESRTPFGESDND